MVGTATTGKEKDSMTSATYKYSLKADSGYKSDQSGRITPERHGVVCAALDGGLSDDLLLLKAAPKLLAALQKLNAQIEADGYMGTTYGPLRFEAEAALAEALGE
jgi:hypothetical protein